MERYSWVLSPDGKTVLYEKDGDVYLEGTDTDREKVAQDAIPVAVENGGGHYFYAKQDVNGRFLYVGDGRKDTKIESLRIGGYDPVICMNEEGNEIVFVDEDDNTRLYRVGSSGTVKLSGKAMDDMLGGFCRAQECRYFTVAVMDRSFKGMVLSAENSLVWINDAYKAVKITSQYEQARMSDDGKEILYISDGKLCKAGLKGDAQEKVLYSKADVELFVASADLSKVYFVTDDGDLYYLAGDKKYEKLEKDFQYDGQIAYNEAAGRLYYIVDGDMYSVDGKANSRKTEDTDVDAVLNGGGEWLFKGILIDQDDQIYYKEAGDKILVMDWSYMEKPRLQRDNSTIAEIANTIKNSMADEAIASSISVPYTITIENKVEFRGDDALSMELEAILGSSVELTSRTYRDHPVTLTITIEDGYYQVTGSGICETVHGEPVTRVY